MQRRIQYSIGIHGLDQTASGLVDVGFTVVSSREDFYESLLIRRFDLFKVSPPTIRVVQELLNALFLKFLFEI